MIVFDYTKVVGGSNLSNFPALISVTDADLKTTGNGGKVGKSDGTDILFTSSDGTTKLSHELEKYVATTGESVFWVKIPTLSASADTTIYMYFGNSGASDQTDKTNVWDSNYKGVWHLPNGTTLGALDSTSGANNGTISGPTATAGKIDGGGNWNGGSDYINTGSGMTLDSNNWTVSTWVYMPSVTTTYTRFLSYYTSGPTIWKNAGSGAISLVHAGTVDLDCSITLTNSEWYQITITRAGSTATCYSNGSQTAQNTSFSASFTNDTSVRIGNSATYNEPATGILDEVRISNTARSAGWIATEYANHSSPSTFYGYNSAVQTSSNTGTKLQGSAGSNSWYNASWGYRKMVVFDRTKVVGGSDLSNFPALISVTDVDLKTTGNGGKVGKSDGTDILFTSSDGTTKLKHELEKYVATTGESVFWVKIPTLSASTDTTVYMYFGNSGASDQTDKTNVWDSNYQNVYHLPDGSTLSLTDSTSNARNGTNVGTVTAGTGQMDGGASFGGANYITATETSLTPGVTLSAWVKLPSTSATGIVTGVFDNTSAAWSSYYLYIDSAGVMYAYMANNNSFAGISSAAGFAGTTWHHMVGIFESTTSRKLYVDGVLIGTDTTSMANPPINSLAIGASVRGFGNIDNYLTSGSLVDEVRVSSTARSAGWIATEYANQNSPGAFYGYNSAVQTASRKDSGGSAAPIMKVRGGVKFR